MRKTLKDIILQGFPDVYFTSSIVTLEINNSRHDHTSETLGSLGFIAIYDSLHAHLSDDIIVTQIHDLVINDSYHGHISDSFLLVQKNILLIDESLHNHISEGIILLQKNILSVNDSYHNHISDVISLFYSHPLLDIDDSNHEHHSSDLIIRILSNDKSIRNFICRGINGN